MAIAIIAAVMIALAVICRIIMICCVVAKIMKKPENEKSRRLNSAWRLFFQR